MIAAVVASLPSPSRNVIEIGPLTLRFYGIMIALGVVAAVWLAQRRWEQRGGDPDDIGRIAVWAVPAGLIGARLYHVITDWRSFQGRWGDVYKIWEGGLGIPGGMLAGVLVGIWAARRLGLDLPGVIDAVVPGLPLAQAIGRWGNWFNQELFGGPTDLPWALEIDPEHRPARYATEATFHPTFLYESLWNLALVALLVWVDRKRVVRPGSLIAVYVAGYATGRLWIEAMRIDPASHILGVRVNIWTSLIALALSLGWLAWRGLRTDEADQQAATPVAETAEDAG